MAKSFATALRREMDAQKMTIAQLSRDSGVTEAYIYRVLAEAQNPSLKIANKLAGAVKMHLVLAKK